MKLFGGFSGVETFFEERNTYKNQVVLSGDVGEPGIENDNSYHVVRIIGIMDQPVTEQMILDGVTIENGFADVYDDNDGGGLIINRASPIIKNVWFGVIMLPIKGVPSMWIPGVILCSEMYCSKIMKRVMTEVLSILVLR